MHIYCTIVKTISKIKKKKVPKRREEKIPHPANLFLFEEIIASGGWLIVQCYINGKPNLKP